MERTGAEPIREVACGELARDAEADGNVSASEPKSPGVSGLLLEDRLCLRDCVLTGLVATPFGEGAFAGDKATSVLGVSTTRKIRGCRKAEGSGTRGLVVDGV